MATLRLGDTAPNFTQDSSEGPIEVVILPSLQDPAEIAQCFPKGYQALRPYLRLTPQPNR